MQWKDRHNIQDYKHSLDCGFWLDRLHFDHKHWGKGPCTSVGYMQDCLDIQSWLYIQAYIQCKDFPLIQANKYKKLLDSFLYIQHSDRREMDCKDQ